MAHSHVIAGEGITQAHPKIRKIGLADLKDALARGLDDFRAMPSHAVFLCLIYPIVGFVIFRLVLGANVLPLLFPLAAGFALIGPFVAIGLYEVSRRREAGQPVSLGAIWSTVRSRSEIGWMAFVTLFVPEESVTDVDWSVNQTLQAILVTPTGSETELTLGIVTSLARHGRDRMVEALGVWMRQDDRSSHCAAILLPPPGASSPPTI